MSDSDSMIERVGEAIAAAFALQNRGELFVWHPEALAAISRAAIEAMREATAAMYDAGHESGDWGPGTTTQAEYDLGHRDACPELCWPAMITTALKESP